MSRKLLLETGAVSGKPWKLYRCTKPFPVNYLHQKNREVYTPETSCMKGTSVDINM